MDRAFQRIRSLMLRDTFYSVPPTKGFLFRIGLSPSFSFNDKHGVTKEPFIYPYISFGYSF